MTVLPEGDIVLLRASQRAMRSAYAGALVLGRSEMVNHIFRRELQAGAARRVGGRWVRT